MADAERPFLGVSLRRALCAVLGVSVFSAIAWRSSDASTPHRAPDVQAAESLGVQAASSAGVAVQGLELTTVIVIRHAEKDATSDPRDPTLSAAGAERARRLAALLRHAGVTHVFASEFKRTRDTLAPLASEIGREIRVVAAADSAALVSELHALPAGSVAVVAGHSNTVPRIVELLGGTVSRVTRTGSAPSLDDAEYGRMFVLHFAPVSDACRVKVSIRELAYGD